MSDKCDDLMCDNCHKKGFDELYSRQGMLMTHYVEFVCADCFLELEGVTFEKHCENKAEDYMEKTEKL